MNCTVPHFTSSQTDISFPSPDYEKLHDFTFHSFIFKILIPLDRHSNQLQSAVYSFNSSSAACWSLSQCQFPFCGVVISREYIISFTDQIILWIKLNFTENSEGWIKESRNHLQQMAEIYISVKDDTHITTDVHLVSQLGLQVVTKNTTVKTPETSKRIHSLSQGKNQWSICCWTNWYLLLLHNSSSHVQITFPQKAMLSGRKLHMSLVICERMTLWVPVVESTHFKRQNTIYRTVAGDSRSADSESADDCKYDWLLQKIKKYDRCDDVDETGLFFNLQHCKCLTFHGDSHHGKENSKEHLLCSMHSMMMAVIKLSPLVNGKYKNVCSLRML